MTQTRRITLNILATYLRSLYALVIGLLAGRWTLEALGQVDYGLMGLVGGLAGFVSFLNTNLASAVGRFYAFSVGTANVNYEKGLRICREWFNTALLIHTVVPLILMLLGYPIGCWAVTRYLTIPPERVMDCVWVWRCVCAGCFVGMVNVPFAAMYSAKQEIAELTVYSFVTTTANFFFLMYMVNHPGVWLVSLAGWNLLIAVVPSIIIAIRAVLKYPECRFVPSFMYNAGRIRQVVKYAFSRFWAQFTDMISGQGKAIMVNKFLGPSFNASMGVGSAVSSHALTLSASLSGAFWPAIANKAGEKDFVAVKDLSFLTCRLSPILVLIFAIPLSVEASAVLRLWLKTPPVFSDVLCAAILMRTACVRMTEGYWMAIFANGEGILRYSWAVGWSGMTILLFALFGFLSGWGMWSIVAGLWGSLFVTVNVRLYYARKYLGYLVCDWIRLVFVPICTIVVLGLLVGCSVRYALPESFTRICLTTFACEVVIMCVLWKFLLTEKEKIFLFEKIGGRFFGWFKYRR